MLLRIFQQILTDCKDSKIAVTIIFSTKLNKNAGFFPQTFKY